jgi:HEAT repeat protein/cyclophilin family peptidyl-prolyl cis-trans isomerase
LRSGIQAQLLVFALSVLPALIMLFLAANAIAAPGTMSDIAIAEDQRRLSDGVIEKALASHDPAARARAARALARIQDSTSIAPLVAACRDSDSEVRREAVFALGEVALAHPGSPLLEPARPALDQMLTRGDPVVLDLAVEALGKLGNRAATPRLVSLLTDPSAQLRGEAAVALWRLADTTAVGALLEHLEDPDPGVRWRVMYALEKVPAPDRIVLRVAQRLVDPDWLTRAYAVRTLGRQKSTRATAYVLQMLSDPEVPVVVNALRALQSIADSSGSFELRALTGALRHPHPYVRVSAATAMGDRFAWVRADSASRRGAVDSLLAHLRDPDAATRGACVKALAARGALGQGNARGMLHDPSPYTCAATLEALPKLGLKDALPLVLPRLAVGSPEIVRMTAADVLGQMKATSEIPELRVALTDSSLLVASAAAGALAAMGDTASITELATAYVSRADDAEPDARQSIRDALRTLAGAAFADSLERAHPVTIPPTSYADDFGTPPAEKGAVLHTSAGDIEWTFDAHEAPQTVRNFIRLARRGYFDSTAIHRVVPNFVIQDGDPTGTGSGGPGYTIRCEYNRLRYEAGMVGMALSGKDTGGSQWFITHSPQPHLNGKYTIFAHVTGGMDVVNRIVQGDRVLKVDILP